MSVPRYCGGCGRILGPDENENLVQEHEENGPTKSFMACTDCYSRITGTPKAERPAYQQNVQIPAGVFICGVCRQTFHESQNYTLGLRLHPDDVAGTDIKPGAYIACGDCVDKYRPKIAERLVASHPGFQKHMLRASGLGVQEVEDLAAQPDGLKNAVAERNLDHVAHCQLHWLQ